MPVTGNNWGNSATTMRVLVADQEIDALEAIARVFEVDVATSKATCVDLLRANDFDVIVACERLSDGSGLELLSHVGQRWPGVLRILAIEPARRAMLKGRLGPFKLFETIAYPIDNEKLEAALTRAAEAMAGDGAPVPVPAPAAAARPRPGPPPATRVSQPPPAPRPPNAPAPRGSGPIPPAQSRPGTGAQRPGPQGQKLVGNAPPAYPPLPAKGSKIVPLGSPNTTEYRILPHDYHEQHMPGTLPTRREDDPKKAPSLQEKAAALAGNAMSAVSDFVRNMKTPGSPPPSAPKAPPPRKKR